MVLAEEPVAAAIAGVEAMQTATSSATHVVASPPTLLEFAIYSSLRNSSLSGSPITTRSKTQCSGLGATSYQLKTLVATTTRSALLGNSGKPVTLETLGLT
jgi:hypothetical protein